MKKKYYILILIFLALFVINIDPVFAKGFSSDEVIDICGFDKVPKFVPSLTSGLYKTIKILVPIILIIVGIVDFVGALSAEDQEKMKKSQKKFITSLIAAIFIFFIMSIVQFIFKKVEFDKYGYSDLKNSFTACWNCLLNNECGESTIKAADTCESRGQATCESENDKHGYACEIHTSSSGVTCRTKCESITAASSCNTYAHCTYTGEYNKGKCGHKATTNQSYSSSSSAGTSGGTTVGTTVGTPGGTVDPGNTGSGSTISVEQKNKCESITSSNPCVNAGGCSWDSTTGKCVATGSGSSSSGTTSKPYSTTRCDQCNDNIKEVYEACRKNCIPSGCGTRTKEQCTKVKSSSGETCQISSSGSCVGVCASINSSVNASSRESLCTSAASKGCHWSGTRCYYK